MIYHVNEQIKANVLYTSLKRCNVNVNNDILHHSDSMTDVYDKGEMIVTRGRTQNSANSTSVKILFDTLRKLGDKINSKH